jgi:predicted amidohydrolase YtcJ
MTVAPYSAELLLRARAIHAFGDRDQPYRVLAVGGQRVLALGDDDDELDYLIGPRTTVVDAGHLTFMPGFCDTHNHMLRAGPDVDRVQPAGTSDLAALVEILRAAAERTPIGEWIVPSRSWHETNLREQRLPSALELDRASDVHPIALRRGGHVMVVNSMALRLAGIDRNTPDPENGTIARDPAGHPNGVLIERPAFEPILARLPMPSFDEQVRQLDRVCRDYNAQGITAIRDPGIEGDEFLVYQRARDERRLTVRSDVMLRLPPQWSVSRMLDELHRWHLRTGFGDDVLRLGGIKLFLDGGVEGGAFYDPYANDSEYRGHLFLNVDELTEVVTTAVERGWEVGCHCVGDHALDTVLAAYERVRASNPRLRTGHLVVEHALLAGRDQRHRAIEAGIGITVQHPLLYSLGANMLTHWGADRLDRALPIRSWVEEGALVAAGTDHNVTFSDPMRSIWGMITRETAGAGVRGASEAVDRRTAFELYTAAGARLLGVEDGRGTLQPGKFADLAGYELDPLTCAVDTLPGTTSELTFVGGQPVHDRQGLADQI